MSLDRRTRSAVARLSHIAVVILLICAVIPIPMLGSTSMLYALLLLSTSVILYLTSALNLVINRRIIIGGRPGPVLRVLSISVVLTVTSLLLEMYAYGYLGAVLHAAVLTSVPGVLAILVLMYSIYMVSKTRLVPGVKR